MPKGTYARNSRRGWSALTLVALSASIAIGTPLMASASETTPGDPAPSATTTAAADPAQEHSDDAQSASEDVTTTTTPAPDSGQLPSTSHSSSPADAGQGQLGVELIGDLAYGTVQEWISATRIVATDSVTKQETVLDPIGGGQNSESTLQISYGLELAGGSTVTVSAQRKDGRVLYYDGSDTGTFDAIKAQALTLEPGEQRSITLNWSAASASAPVEVTPPSVDTLTDGTKGGIKVPVESLLGETITVTVGLEHAGHTVNGWLFSTPTALGQAVVDANGNVTFTLPSTVPAGAHRLAITNTQNNLVGWGNIQLSNAVSVDTSGQPSSTPTLAATGSDIPLGLAIFALLTMTLGLALVVAKRRLRRG